MITITVDVATRTTHTLLKDEDYLIQNLNYLQNNSPHEIRLGQNYPFSETNKGQRLDGFDNRTFNGASSVYIKAYGSSREIEVY